MAQSLCVLGLVACATQPLTETGALSSYTHLKPSEGMLTRTRLYADKDALLDAKSVRIIPTQVFGTARAGLSDSQLQLVTNVIDRSLCQGLSRRYEIVDPGRPADLTVKAVITNIGKTDVNAAGVSNVVGVGGRVAGAVTGLPIPQVRIPIGMGGLAVEAQAELAGQEQVAAMTWARGADALTTNARIAEEGDAYTLAKQFADDFAKLLLTGEDPIKGVAALPSLPTVQSVGEFFGGKPKYAACERFGPQPGLPDMVGSMFGTPPDWADGGAAAQATAATSP